MPKPSEIFKLPETTAEEQKRWRKEYRKAEKDHNVLAEALDVLEEERLKAWNKIAGFYFQGGNIYSHKK